MFSNTEADDPARYVRSIFKAVEVTASFRFGPKKLIRISPVSSSSSGNSTVFIEDCLSAGVGFESTH